MPDAQGPAPISAVADGDEDVGATGWRLRPPLTTPGLTLHDASDRRTFVVRATATSTHPTAFPDVAGVVADVDGLIVTGPAPGEWTVVAPASSPTDPTPTVTLADAVGRTGVHVDERTHGTYVLHLDGEAAADVLSRLCRADLRALGRGGASLRTQVAGVVVELVTPPSLGAGVLLVGSRSTGRWMWDELVRVAG